MAEIREFPQPQILKRIEDLEQHGIARRGGPPYDGGMEARVAKLEAGVESLQRDAGEIKLDVREIKRDARTDFRLLFGAIIALGLGMAGLMAKGFHWL